LKATGVWGGYAKTFYTSKGFGVLKTAIDQAYFGEMKKRLGSKNFQAQQSLSQNDPTVVQNIMKKASSRTLSAIKMGGIKNQTGEGITSYAKRIAKTLTQEHVRKSGVKMTAEAKAAAKKAEKSRKEQIGQLQQARREAGL
jgi:hypothetical protein